MPKAETKNRNLKQLIASLLVDADVPADGSAYVIKAPIAGTDRAKETRSNLTLYGVEMTEGIGIVTDREASAYQIQVEKGVYRPLNARELAEKITSEFPEYTFEELN